MNRLDVPVYSFKFEGGTYRAMGNWEIGWVKWALKHDTRKLRSFIQNETRLQEEMGL